MPLQSADRAPFQPGDRIHTDINNLRMSPLVDAFNAHTHDPGETIGNFGNSIPAWGPSNVLYNSRGPGGTGPSNWATDYNGMAAIPADPSETAVSPITGAVLTQDPAPSAITAQHGLAAENQRMRGQFAAITGGNWWDAIGTLIQGSPGTPQSANISITGFVSGDHFVSTHIDDGITAPFTVTSTKTVTNLSSDMVDGLHAQSTTTGELGGTATAYSLLASNPDGYLSPGLIEAATSKGVYATPGPSSLDDAANIRYVLQEINAAGGQPSWDTPVQTIVTAISTPGGTPTAGPVTLQGDGTIVVSGDNPFTIGLSGSAPASGDTLTFGELYQSFVLSGLDVTAGTGLHANAASGVAYIPGNATGSSRAVLTGSVTNINIPASGTYYLDWTGNGNSAANFTTSTSPVPASNVVRLAKLTTNGTTITSITKLREFENRPPRSEMLNLLDVANAQHAADVADWSPYLQEANDLLADRGGGVIFLQEGQTFQLVPSANANGTVKLSPGVSIKGAGPSSVLQIKANNGVGWANYFYGGGTSTTPFTGFFEDFTFDVNGPNNAGTVGGAVTGTNTQRPFYLTDFLNGVWFNRIRFVNAGSLHLIRCHYTGPTSINKLIRISNCYVSFVMNSDSTGSAQADYDNTAFYPSGLACAVVDNHFEAPIQKAADGVTPRGARTCIETTGGPSIIEGNTSIGYRTGCFVNPAYAEVGDSGMGITGAAGNGSVANNTFTQCNDGIQVVNTSSQWVQSVTVVDNNDWTVAPAVTFTGGGAGTQATAVATLSGSHVVVTVTSTGHGYISAPTVTLVGGTGTYTSATAVMSDTGSVVGNTTITGNLVTVHQVDHNLVYCHGITIYRSTPGFAGTVKNLTITGNAIWFQDEGAGRAQGYGSGGGALTAIQTFNTAGISLATYGVVEGVTVSGNSIYRAPGIGIQVGNVGTSGTPPVMDTRNCQVTNNLLYNPGQNLGIPIANRIGLYLTTSVSSTSVTGNVVTDLWSSAVDSVAVTAGGTGYTSAPTVVFSGGNGQGARAHAVLTGTAVTSVVMDDRGSGYTSAPTVTFIGGAGSGATGTSTLGTTRCGRAIQTDGGSTYSNVLIARNIITPARGSVSQIAVTNGGTGYTSAPTVAIAAPTAPGVQATATATIAGGVVTAITIVNPGSGYTTHTPAVTFSGGAGSGAAATATVTMLVNVQSTINTGDTWYDANGNAVASISNAGVITAAGLTITGTAFTTSRILAPSTPTSTDLILSPSSSGGGGGTGGIRVNYNGVSATALGTGVTGFYDGTTNLIAKVTGNDFALNVASGKISANQIKPIATQNDLLVSAFASSGKGGIRINYGGSAPAQATATFTGTITGGVLQTGTGGVTIVSGGAGYASATGVATNTYAATITRGAGDTTGTAATATVTVSGGAVTAINITNGGNSYTATPTITIDAPQLNIITGFFNGGNTLVATIDISGNLNLAGSLNGAGFVDGAAFSTGTVTGTKIGTSTSQKIGFFNATPVAKQANPGTAAGTDAAVINAVITALRNLGLVT